MLEHVVVVTDSLTVDGGSAKVALGSALALAERGIGVTVFSAAGEACTELAARNNVQIISTEQGEALSSRNKAGGALQGLWNRRARARMDALLATLDRQRTVVHVHSWTKALSSSVVASVVRAKFPVVITLHEYFTACPTGCLYLHRDRKVCTLIPMSFACITKHCDSRSYVFKAYRVLRQFIQRKAAAIPSGVEDYITVSPFSQSILKPMLPPTSRYHAVNNPVDVEPAPRNAAEQNDTFVFVGRLSAEKGGALLAEAARRAGVKVVFIGDGSERAEIERINPDAQMTGWLDSTSVAEHVRSARCVVVPSRWYETFGLVVLEAAALGIPAIVPTGTAVLDLVDPGATGLAFEQNSVDDLTAQLRRCADDELVARMSRSTYAAFWSGTHTMESHVDNLLAVYGNVLQTFSAAPPETAA